MRSGLWRLFASLRARQRHSDDGVRMQKRPSSEQMGDASFQGSALEFCLPGTVGNMAGTKAMEVAAAAPPVAAGQLGNGAVSDAVRECCVPAGWRKSKATSLPSAHVILLSSCVIHNGWVPLAPLASSLSIKIFCESKCCLRAILKRFHFPPLRCPHPSNMGSWVAPVT